MSALLDLSCPELKIVIDQGSSSVMTWTIPGTGDLTGTVEMTIERRSATADVATVDGVITNAAERKVQIALTSALTQSLPLATDLRYAVSHIVDTERVVIAKGPLMIKGTAL